MRQHSALDEFDREREAVHVIWWRWLVIATALALALFACSGGGGGVPVVTTIESFTVTPNPVAPGGTITLNWRTANVGLYEGSPYCTLQRTVQSSPADDAQQVDCSDTITATAPSEATTMTYRLSALKREGVNYVTRDITVTVRAPSPMLIDVDTNLIAGTTVALPLRGSVDVSVDWGDGQTSTATTSGDLQHTYASNGRYTVSISGSLSQFGRGIYYSDSPHAAAITAVSAWGELGPTSLSGAFASATNLRGVPTTLPPTVTDTSGMFSHATSFNQPIGNWDTSNVENMNDMFWNATAFNQPIGDWDTSNVNGMAYMFSYAEAFNQPIGAWDTSNVTDMSGMFQGSAFNQPLELWDTSNVTAMSQMFLSTTSFDQPLDAWDTSKVTSMFGMFWGAEAFDQPVGSWDTSNVGNMSWMFAGATAFDQPISTWNTGNVTDMSRMFYGAGSFNRDLSGWCVVLIPSRPDVFDDGAISWSLPRPAWGTCP
jgi:surface protein